MNTILLQREQGGLELNDAFTLEIYAFSQKLYAMMIVRPKFQNNLNLHCIVHCYRNYTHNKELKKSKDDGHLNSC